MFNHPHNFHLELAIDTGLIGYSIFLLFVFYLLKELYSLKIEKKFLLKIIFYLIIIFIFLPRPTGSIFTTFLNNYWYFVGSLLGYSKLLVTDKRMSKTYLNK